MYHVSCIRIVRNGTLNARNYISRVELIILRMK